MLTSIVFLRSRVPLTAKLSKFIIPSLTSVRFKANTTKMYPSIKYRCDDILSSPEDKRAYCGLELQNGLKILLISDATTDKSAAAMDVNIGSMSDPVTLPGLAHFCEHMLFLGTEKYNEENEYSKFLNEHGGMSNAFTSSEHTNYYFDVSPEHLKGALDRFAQFFLCPLFTASATEREVNAVNSENEKNLQQDLWRVHQLDKSTCKPDHAFSKFSTGNKQTLETIPAEKGIDVRAELLKFHQAHYSSNVMALSVLGKESIDELIELVVPLFADVQNKSVSVPEWFDHPYGPEQLQTITKAVPVKDLRNLVICWAIPDLHKHYKSNPGHYLAHLIGHEGEGSLLSELKRKGWVNRLVGGQKEAAKGFGFFMISVDLTEDGIENIDEIVTLSYQYLKMLHQNGYQQWIFEECRDLNAMMFRFHDKEIPRDYTSHCSALLHDYPIKEVLSGNVLLEEYRPDLIKMLLDKLVPDNMRVLVVSKKFSGLTDKIEKWYGTQYSLEKIPESTIQKWMNVELHPNLALPQKNEFVPTNFDLMPREKEINNLPIALRDSELSLVWCQQDNFFLLPKMHVSIEMTSPYVYVDPLSTNLAHMFVILCKDALNEYTYDAELAGLHYDLSSTVYGLVLSVSGYHDKLHILLQKIVDKMTKFHIDSQRFDLLKEDYVRSLKNFKADLPYQHAMYFTTVVVSEQVWTKSELLEATEEMTVKKLEDFIPQLLSKLHLEFLIDGNVTQQGALHLADMVEEKFKTNANCRPLLASQHRRLREVQLPDGCYYLYRVSNEIHQSSSLEVYLQCGMQETRSNMLLELYNQIINEPCFDILRTREQLGYIVASGVRRACGVQGLRIIVQSNRSPDYVEQRIEAFLFKMESHLKELTDESFQQHVHALSSKILEKPKRLGMQHQKFWAEIITQQYHFDRDNVEAELLKTLKKEDILNFHKELIAHDAPKRHKLSVHVIPTGTSSDVTSLPENITVGEDGDITEEELQEVQQIMQQSAPIQTNDSADGLIGPPSLAKPKEINELNEFKKQLGLFPLPKPYINISTAKSKL